MLLSAISKLNLFIESKDMKLKKEKIVEEPTETQNVFINLANSIHVTPSEGCSLEHRFTFYKKYGHGTLLKRLKIQVGLEILANLELLSDYPDYYVPHKPIYALTSASNRSIYHQLTDFLEQKGFSAKWDLIDNDNHLIIKLKSTRNKEMLNDE